jgi:hypothetical protein
MTPIEFASEILVRIGLPVSENNIAALVGLQAQEGGHIPPSTASFNPMNVTQFINGNHRAPGFPENGPQIQAYPDWETGLRATTMTFKSGFYKSVLASLVKSAPPNDTLHEISLSPFGWYKIDKATGKRIQLPYPLAIAAAAAWRLYGSKPFPGPSGGWIATSENALKDFFTPRTSTAKYGLFMVAGVMALAGIALIAYGGSNGSHKHRA